MSYLQLQLDNVETLQDQEIFEDILFLLMPHIKHIFVFIKNLKGNF
jgi:hypothetical protein